MSNDTRLRARREILNYILQFSVANRMSDGSKSCWATEPFFSESMETNGRHAPVGTIVILTAAPSTKYTIGWLRDVRYRSGREYLIESLDDGDRCWWGNVGIKYMDPEEVKKHAHWAYSDRQFAFKEKWFRFCHKAKDSYCWVPWWPEFGEGYAVTIGLRKKWSDQTAQRDFPDWRKITREMMGKCFDECVEQLSSSDKERQRLQLEDKVLASTVGAENEPGQPVKQKGEE